MNDVTKDLLEALKGLMALSDHRVDLRDQAKAARSAIAEAEAAPKAARLTMGECMQAVKHLSFDEMTLFGIAHAIESAVLRKNGIEVAE